MTIAADQSSPADAPGRTEPLVSIVIPARQAADTIVACVRAALRVDYPHLEVAVCDNASTDGTSELLGAIDDPRLRVVRHEEQVGLGDNFNRAVALARGRYVKVVCADDLLLPGCLHSAVAVLEANPEVALAVGLRTLITRRGTVLLEGHGPRRLTGRHSREDTLRRIVRHGANPIGDPSTVLFRRAQFEQLGGWDSRVPHVLDLDLWVRLLALGDLYGTPDIVSRFEINPAGFSARRPSEGYRQQRAFTRALLRDGGTFTAADRLVNRVATPLAFSRSLGLYAAARVETTRGPAGLPGRPRVRTDDEPRPGAIPGVDLRVRRGRSPVEGPLPVPAGEPEVGSSVEPRRLSCAVVICAFTEVRMGDLDRAVDSLGRQTRPPTQIVLAIDHNPTLATMCEQRFPHVRIVRSREPKGLSGARNAGIAATTADVVAFLDDDAVAEPAWVEQLLAPMEASPRVDVVGGRTVPAWDSRRPIWFPAEFDWVIGATYRGVPPRLHEVRNPFGGNAAWRRTVFDRAGLFATGIGRDGDNAAGCEETELSIRLAAADPSARQVYTPDAVIRHRVTHHRSTPGYFVTRCRAEGVSKARVARLGGRAATSRESDYVHHVLAPAAWGYLAAAARERRPGEVLRAFAIVAGLAATAGGFVAQQVRDRAPILREVVR